MSNLEEAPVASGSDEQSEASQRPTNVPLRLWEKFQALEKRTNEATKRSTEKRIKHLQKTALENVARALNHPEDKEIVTIPPVADDKTGKNAASSSSGSVSLSSASRKRPADWDSPVKDSGEQNDRTSTEKTTSTGESTEKQWQEVRGLLGVNDHLAGVSHGSLGPKTVLELQIDNAIATGDYKKAEELSDHMSNREFGEKVAKAIDARNFLQHKQEEEEMVKTKRKKKLHWGFEAKHRWETKSNM